MNSFLTCARVFKDSSATTAKPRHEVPRVIQVALIYIQAGSSVLNREQLTFRKELDSCLISPEVGWISEVGFLGYNLRLHMSHAHVQQRSQARIQQGTLTVLTTPLIYVASPLPLHSNQKMLTSIDNNCN